MQGQAEEQHGHAQQRVQQQQNQAGDDQPPRDSALVAFQLGEALLALYLGRGDRETDIRSFGVAKARTAGLRKLATRKLFDEALNVLRGKARVKRTMWSRRAQEYEAKINSGDPLAIAEVVRDLHRNAGQPDQSFSERQIYESAMDRLAAELAALDKTDKATAITKLTDFLKTV